MITFIIYYFSIFAVFLIISKLSPRGSFLHAFTTPFTWAFSAIVMALILLPIGFLYDLGKSLYEGRGIKFLTAFWHLIREVLLVFSWMAEKLAIGIDIMGNVVSGELIEDCITSEEATLFRKAGVTISASTGQVEDKSKLNPTGLWFTKALSTVFEPNHAILAYKAYLYDEERNNAIGAEPGNKE